MSVNTAYYNYYNVQGHYSPATPETPGIKQRFEATTDKVKSVNYDKDSDMYKAYTKLEETYYSLGVSNRSKYSTVSEVKSALYQKYFRKGNYSQYSKEERNAMYQNELHMTLYGCLKGVGCQLDPHLKGEVKTPAEYTSQDYNRQMVNTQLGNIFSNGGIDMSVVGKYNLLFSIDPYSYALTVSGTNDADLTQTLERLLNDNNNSRELFYHILHSNSGSISEDVLLKYHALRNFASVTGENPRNYKLTENGLVNENGQNILDVYKDALKTSNAVPAGFKGDAYSNFKEDIETLLAKDYMSIPDLALNIGYQNNMLLDVSNETVTVSRFYCSA